MNEFPIAKTEDAYQFCCEIKAILIELTGCSEEAAAELILKYWKGVNNIEDNPFLYEELAYFYARSMIHHPVLGDGRLEWYRDLALWPPPIKYRPPSPN